jgi:hypothetical protein
MRNQIFRSRNRPEDVPGAAVRFWEPKAKKKRFFHSVDEKGTGGRIRHRRLSRSSFEQPIITIRGERDDDCNGWDAERQDSPAGGNRAKALAWS